MFEVDGFIVACVTAQADSEKAVREVVKKAVSDPAGVMKALGEPREAGLHTIHRSDTLTILNIVWTPLMNAEPHDHQMWAVIGVYTGGEDNIFWRRKENRIEAAGASSLRAGDAEPLGWNIIHSVTNPTGKLTGSIHVYGGDFFTKKRSEWNPETLQEQPYDMARTDRFFDNGNALYKFMTEQAHR